MKLTALRPNQTNDGFSVYIDGKYSFSVDADTILDNGLRVGQELDTGLLELLKARAENRVHYRRILHFVSLRARSEGEVRDYAYRKKIPAEILTEIILKLQRLGLLNDEQFARRWVEYKLLQKPMSKKRLKLELSKKHIAPAIIDEVLAEEGAVPKDSQSIVAMVAKLKTRSRYQDKQKLMRYLAGQGYAYDDIKRALEQE